MRIPRVFTAVNGCSADDEDVVGSLRLASAVALALALAACNGGDSDNVMASSANSLTPAQVDLALGPEPTNDAGNQLESSNGMNALEPSNAVEAADEEDALDESVTDEPADEPATSNNGAESDAGTTA